MRTISTVTVMIGLCAAAAFAQQEKGDKEIGIGGQLYYRSYSVSTGSGSSVNLSSGTGSFQFSFGFFASPKNYFGFEADPTVSITGIGATKSTPSSTTTSVGGLIGGNYRRLLGSDKGKVFFFIGGGGGVNLQTSSGGGAGSSNSSYGSVFPEVGLKSFMTQKTSLEFGYRMIVQVSSVSSGTSFQNRVNNQVEVSVRHIF
jgi:hypothetical protein